jgi:hypothetical protein
METSGWAAVPNDVSIVRFMARFDEHLEKSD